LWHGYKRLRTEYKPAGLHELLADREADRLPVADPLWSWSAPKFSVAPGSDADEPGLALKAGRSVAFSRKKRLDSTLELLLTGEPGTIEAAGIELSRSLGWDCVFTKLTAGTSRIRVGESTGSPMLEVTLRGFVEPEYELELDKFRERLLAEPPAESALDSVRALIKT
jgi:hypothetical protein